MKHKINLFFQLSFRAIMTKNVNPLYMYAPKHFAAQANIFFPKHITLLNEVTHCESVPSHYGTTSTDLPKNTMFKNCK